MRLIRGLSLGAAVLAAAAPTAAGDAELTVLPVAAVRDVEARGDLLARGIPITPESVSPDGFHFAHLHHVSAGFLGRTPERCAFLLDLATGENRPARAPKGRAERIGGWDPTGRYLLIETQKPDFLHTLTGGWTTYHWILDVVTSEFVPRRRFTGTRNDERFRWRARGAYRGAWLGDAVVPLVDGELATIRSGRTAFLQEEDERRLAEARRLAVLSGDERRRTVAEVLPRLDQRWTRRGRRDPVIADTFGDRPTLLARTAGGGWTEAAAEVDYVAVLDHGLALVTAPRARQFLLFSTAGEILPLPPAPEGWDEKLDHGWDAEGADYYDEQDLLPRDLQYRRSFDEQRGIARYFHYVLVDRTRVLTLYWFAPDRRVLRVVDLPETWHRTPR